MFFNAGWEDGEAGRHAVTLESDHLVRQREAMCVSEAKAIHLPPPIKKLTHLVRGAFLFFNAGGGRRSRAARSDAGVGPPGSTARSDVRERSEGNSPPTTILQSDVGIHFAPPILRWAWIPCWWLPCASQPAVCDARAHSLRSCRIHLPPFNVGGEGGGEYRTTEQSF